MVKKLDTKAEFDAALNDAGTKLVVVDFFAEWCGPCKAISPKIVEMEKEYTDVVFYKVDVDENDETAEYAGIQAMPTFILYKSGEKVESMTGANAASLKDLIEKCRK